MLYKWRVHHVLLERSRLAREFHDTLAQSFVALIWQIERAKSYAGSSVPEPALECLDRAMDHAREGLSEARRAVHALRAGVLDESDDFLSAVKILLQPETAGATLASHLSVVGKPYQLSKEWEQALIRILQEGINNAIKHAKAKRFDVHLEFRKHEVRFRMRDDGKGFTMNESAGEMAPAQLMNPHFSSGLGLIGMRERCLRLGGKFSIHSSPGKGTSIEIIVPKRRFGWFTPLSSLRKISSRRRIIKSKLQR
jgi:signal transduction histidine kinase